MSARCTLAVLFLLAASPAALAQGWTVAEVGVVEPTDPFPAWEEFGHAVAVDGDTAVIAAPEHPDGGYVRVYAYAGGAWSEQAVLEPSAGAPYEPSSSFGASVAIRGDTLAVGAPELSLPSMGGGSVVVFTRLGTTWSEQAKLVGSAVDVGDQFGYSVALEGDTLLVGAKFDEEGSNIATGGAYVFVRAGSSWSEESALFPSGGQLGDEFGASVALSGSTALIGSPDDDVGGQNDQGSIYLFVRSGTTWSQQVKLMASDGLARDWFGTSVGLEGDTAVVGAPGRDGGSAQEGAAYVFARTGTDWSEDTILTVADAGTDDVLGSSVSLSGDTIVAGAPKDDHAGGQNTGSARVFLRTGTTWAEQAALTSSESGSYFEFGSAVAVSGDHCAVGAPNHPWPGKGYLFERSGTTWTEELSFALPDVGNRHWYGAALSMSAGRALIGDPYETSALGGGGAYVFAHDGTAWSQESWLQSPDAGGSTLFGASVSLDGDRAAVGSYDLVLNGDAGAVYLFEYGTGWTLQHKLEASDGQLGDRFGQAVALQGDTLIVGAAWIDRGGLVNSGAAYVFARAGTVWVEQQKLTAGVPTAFTYFGWATAISGDTMLIGARNSYVHVYVKSGSSWTEQAVLAGVGVHASFGSAVDLEGDTALIGDSGALLGGINTGAAYVYERLGTTWGSPVQLAAAGGKGGDRFAWSLSLQGDLAVIGAPRVDAVNSPLWDEGSAYAFVQQDGTWSEVAEYRAAGVDETDLFGSRVAVEGDRILTSALEIYDEGYEAANASGGPGNTNGPGTVYAFRFFGDPPVSYCAPGTSAKGCQATLSVAGVPSANAPSGFVVSAANAEGKKNGLFYFGTSGRQENPWGNGTSLQCVVPPLARTGLLIGSGAPGACGGAFARDLNAVWSASPSKNPGTGSATQIQLWYRDPQNTSNQTTSLSDAIEVVVGP